MTKPPILLAIETSVGPCSAAILRGGEVLAEETILDFHQQSRMLVPLCERVLAKAGVAYSELDGIASSCGPGSFTSIRVGLAAAKALAFAASKPFYGVSTLEALAFAAKDEGNEPLLACLDAHRSEVYAQMFTPDALPGSDALVTPTSHLRERFKEASYRLIGNAQDAALEQFPGSIKSALLTPSAVMVSKLVQAKLRAGDIHNFLTSPVYIRPPDAKLPAQTFSGA